MIRTKKRTQIIFSIIILQLVTILDSNAQNTTFQIWLNKIPGQIEDSSYTEKQVLQGNTIEQVSFVTRPTLSVYVPKDLKANGTAVVILPGGGYSHLSMNKEGAKIAEWLNSLGITAFLLKYRLPNDKIMKDKAIGPLQDAQQAMRYIRKNATTWNINPDKIGIIGFSAGGHLGATLSTQYDEKTTSENDTTSARPNFSILIYPVISMRKNISHSGSKTALLGKRPNKKLVNNYSSEKKVNRLTPPTFLVHATDDKSVSFKNSLIYYNALQKHSVPVELHLYEKGGHGFGIKPKDIVLNWTTDCENWLLNHSFL